MRASFGRVRAADSQPVWAYFGRANNLPAPPCQGWRTGYTVSSPVPFVGRFFVCGGTARSGPVRLTGQQDLEVDAAIPPQRVAVANCHRSSVVEHALGKGEVTGSSPVGGFQCSRQFLPAHAAHCGPSATLTGWNLIFLFSFCFV